MEAENHGASGFDLDKSFMYLRASGHFSANEFIKLSDADWKSTTRVVLQRVLI